MPKQHSREWYEGRIEMLRYLIDVAKSTEGADVWRALFAEGQRSEKLEMDAAAQGVPTDLAQRLKELQ